MGDSKNLKTQNTPIIIISAALQDKALKELHINHMGIEKTMLLAYRSIYWITIHTDTEKTVVNCPTCFNFQVN